MCDIIVTLPFYFARLLKNINELSLPRKRESRLVPVKTGNQQKKPGFPASSAGQALLPQE